MPDLPSRPLVVVFLNSNKESQEAKTLLEKRGIAAVQIHVTNSSEPDIPKLVTEKKVFVGQHQIEQYVRLWARP
jgi:phosphoribosylanthranilate isomerase